MMTLHENIHQGTGGHDILVLVWTAKKGTTLHEKFRQGSGGPDASLHVQPLESEELDCRSGPSVPCLIRPSECRKGKEMD